MENEIYIGARDTQTAEQKALNFKFEEVCRAAGAVNWVEKLRSEWRSFPIRNQDGSSQCVCMTYSTELGIIFKQKYGVFMDFSSCYPYQQRKYPQWGGCTSEDIYDVFPKLGSLFENYMPSQNIGESACMKVPKLSYYDDLAKTFKVKRISLPINFETVASTIQETGKGVMVWFSFDHSEWTNIPEIKVTNPTGGHSVTAVDFTLKDGKKYLVIQDSWGLQYAMNGLRLISEEYFNARCYSASYLMTFQTLDTSDKTITRPKYDGKTIVSFQECMKWEGLFPANVGTMESYGPITRSACVAFQKRFGLVADGILGPKTKAKVLSIYN